MSNKETSKDMAEDRTDWAEDRTLLANERTFNSWMGTALGSLGMAVGLQAVFGETEPTWLAKLVATIFIVLALMIVFIGYRKSVATAKRLKAHSAKQAKHYEMFLIASILSTGGLAISVILWML